MITKRKHWYTYRDIVYRDNEYTHAYVSTVFGIVDFRASSQRHDQYQVLEMVLNGVVYEQRDKIDGLPTEKMIVRRCNKFALKIQQLITKKLL